MNWAIFILRLGLGIIFVGHGLQKAFGLFGGSGIEIFSKTLLGLGFSPGWLWAYLVAYIELIGGLFLIIGLFVRTFSFLFILIMSVALFKVHLSKGFFITNGGFEYNFLIICVCVALIIMGSGKLGINNRF